MNTVSKIPGKVIRGINSYFFDDSYSAHPLVALRICTGFILLLQFICLRHDIMPMIESNGILRQELIDAQMPWYFLSSYKITQFLSTQFGISELQGLYLLAVIYVTTILTMIAGILTRISAFLLWIIHSAILVSGYYFAYGMDYFLTIFLFYIIVFPTHREYSVDQYLFRLKPVNYTPYVRILQVHLCMVYFIGGLAKSFGVNWWNGISIVKAIVRPDETFFSDTTGLGNYQWLFVAAGIGTIILEIGYPVFIHLQKTRKIWLALTYLMHLSIAVFIDLPLFAATMVLFNIAAFYFPVKTTSGKAISKQEPLPQLQIAHS